jgi:hypothetical protein
MVPPVTISTFDADASVCQLAHQHVADERNRLEVAAPPAVVLGGDHCNAALDLLGRRRGERVAHHEYGGRDTFRKRVVALRHTARQLQIDALVVVWLARDQFRDDRRPFARGVRVRETDPVEAALQAGEMLRQAERLAAIDGDEFVDAVAEDESAVEHGNLRVLDGEKRAVQVNRHSGSRPGFVGSHRCAASRRLPRRGRSPWGGPAALI